ncbi:MAG TPA: U32 family peptidase C-terminal domain-containing protein [Dissulfurispiraceae bacterium]|nr:U32 family peptidase C-terminal domain-containing protein [Dissulfurispiraceae bacterium]
MNRPELLCPAGDFEKMRAAIHYGADAVYLGDPHFSLRNKAKNFDAAELREAVKYAHERNVSVYVTVNIFARSNDLPAIREHIGFLNDIMPDAVIISDPGVFMLFKEEAPQIKLHVSTQANVTNSESAGFWKRMGAQRIILSRELSIEEIRVIAENVDIELEAFVHGSVCLSYAGKCYLSSFMASRSANSGECTNSCRWKYALVEEKRPGQYFPVFEDDRGAYVMNSKDLCLIEHLPRLLRAGVKSFKIEGRMKGLHYVAAVTKCYREAIDKLDDDRLYAALLPEWEKELALFSNRGYTAGLLFDDKQSDLYNFTGTGYNCESEVIGIVTDRKAATAKVLLRAKLMIGDSVEYLLSASSNATVIVESLRYEDGIDAVSASSGETVLIKAPEGSHKGDLVRKLSVKK